MEYAQFLVLIPIGFMCGWIKVLTGRLDRMKESTHTKTETTELIKLHQEPIHVEMQNIKESCNDIKRMLQRVLDAK